MHDGFVKGLSHLLDLVIAKCVSSWGPRLDRSPVAAPEDGFLLGCTLATPQSDVYLRPSERRRHMYALGATGCGKTNLLVRLIDDDIQAGRTCVVVDLRGDLIDRVIVRLAKSTEDGLTERLSLIDLREDEFAVGLNPLYGPAVPHSRALHVLGVLRRNADSWGIQLEETLRNCLVALAETGWSLLEVEQILTDERFRERVVSQCTDQYVKSFFDRYQALSKEQRTTWSLAVLNKVSALLAVPQLRRVVGQRTGFSWRQELDAPGRIILVALAADRFHGASNLIGGLMVSSIQNAIMARADLPEAERPAVSLYIDEFETMASDSFQTIIAEGRRFGLSLVLSHQNLSQLPSDLRQVVRNNVHLQLYFQTGAIDASDLASEVVSKDSRDAVRQTLISQAVGEAILVRRGRPSLRIKTIHSPDPKADSQTVTRLKRTAIERIGSPSEQIDAELRQRRNTRDLTTQDSPMEVRHERLPKRIK